MVICIFKNNNCDLEPRLLESTYVLNGTGKILGNKGAVVISFKILNKSFLFIGAHLAAF